MTTIEKAFNILQTSGRPMTWMEVLRDIPGTNAGTVSRAMRTLFARGRVTRQPQNPTKRNGIKLWTAIPNAIPATHQITSSVPQPVAPRNSGKVTIMCLPANKPTLVTATLQAITELINDKMIFSAHNVTKKLRDMVKDGKANVDHTESGTVFAYGKTLPRIEHEDVKGIVHEYFQSGKMDGYDRVMKGDHWTYSPVVAAQAAPPAVVVLTPGPDYNGDPTVG